MNTSELETRLTRAAAVTAPPRSIVDDVMRQIGSTLPNAAPRSRWRHPVLAASFAALGGVAAILALVFFMTGGVSLTLADVQNAFEGQRWVHIRYDAGQIKEDWTDLQTGESYATRFDGDVVYINDQSNTRLWYSKDSGVIEEDFPTIYAPGRARPHWTPQSAWTEFVVPYEELAAATQPTSSSFAEVVVVKDILNGVSVIRFDGYSTDAMGKRFLLSQLWANPTTHLPLRIKRRLQLDERERFGREWGIGDYDFPATGPADLYALGVPRGLPIHKDVTVAPTEVQPLIDGINHAHDNFLKNYRTVIWSTRPHSLPRIENLEIIWRDGEKVRDDSYPPPYELQSRPAPLYPALTPKFLLAWASEHEPDEMQLMDAQREYSWLSAAFAKASKPQVQVFRHDRFTLLATGTWPENIQWPTRYYEPDFQLLAANPETPAGFIGLRWTDGGNSRTDYYIDPANDYVCVKQIEWTKRGSHWVKTRQYTLSDLHRIAGHVVAGAKRIEDYGDPTRNIYPSTVITRIDLVPITEYPPGTFDPKSLTTGATVIGY